MGTDSGGQGDVLNETIERVIYSTRDRTIRETEGLLNRRLKKT